VSRDNGVRYQLIGLGGELVVDGRTRTPASRLILGYHGPNRREFVADFSNYDSDAEDPVVVYHEKRRAS